MDSVMDHFDPDKIHFDVQLGGVLIHLHGEIDP